MIVVGDLVHFDLDGWCIFSDIVEKDGEIIFFEFMSLILHDGKPRKIRTRAPDQIKNSDLECKMKYTEIENLKKIKSGSDVFYMEKKFKKNAKRNGSKITFGILTSINFETQNAIIDHQKTIKIINLIKLENNFEQASASGQHVCRICRKYEKQSFKKQA